LSQFDELPEGWIETIFSEIFYSLQYGYTASASFDINEPKFLRITDIQDHGVDWEKVPGCLISSENISKYLIADDDILFARTGSIEKAWRAQNVPLSVFASYLIRGKLVDRSISVWIEKFIKSFCYLNQIGAIGAGTGRNNINAKNLSQVSFPLPPLNEQRRIVAKIEALGAHSRRSREALDAVPGLIEQFRQSVLAAAFRGDLTADWRSKNNNRDQYYLTAEELELGQPFKQARCQTEKILELENVSALPKLPDGWFWGTPNLVCQDIVDCPHTTAKYTETGKILVRTSDFRVGHLDLTNVKFVNKETFEKRTKRLKPLHQDILYSREGGIFGVACLVPSDVEICMGQRMMLLRVDRDYYVPELLMWAMNSPQFFRQASQHVTGSASPHVNVGDIKNFVLPIPPLKEQKEILSVIRRMLQSIQKASDTYLSLLKDLSDLDQSILAKAFRGELVPQDPNDEPASVLLERIRAEREQLAAATKPGKRRRKQP